MQKEFLENDISHRTMKNFASLAFVSEGNVIEEFVKIKENASDVLDSKKKMFVHVFRDFIWHF